MWKAHMLHLCFETKYLEVFKMLCLYAYLVPSMVIFLTLFVLVFLSFPFSRKSSSETIGLPLLDPVIWIVPQIVAHTVQIPDKKGL